MAKPKAPTPQEIYRQRREREEKEKNAYLPPGLINHGNTCFMNSVLQGLIATRLLVDLVYFQDIPPEIQVTAATPIVSRRSPQLTNGHNLAGSYEKAWVNTMPIGDMFLTVMYKAWTSQAGRTREIISPKPILGALGQKYDQYLDFAQQDAHEFLRILLDAMRMEEQDIIKQRQPPRPKRRRRTTITPGDVRTPTQEDTELPLLSFADMLFGGQLTSILVCQTCKHVSQSYEEFNDISLSIKSDDYMHHRKRDRFRKLVGRLTGNSTQEKEQPKNAGFIHAVEMLRASSVPPSPRAERDVQLGHEAPPPNHKDSARRRSFDMHVEPPEGEAEVDPAPAIPQGIAITDSKSSTDTRDSVTLESENSHVLVNVTSPNERHVEFTETESSNPDHSSALLSSSPSKLVHKSQKQEDSSWTKIGRRISLSVGLGRPRSTDKEKEKKDRERKTRSIGAIMENEASSDTTPRPLPDVGVSPSRNTLSPNMDSETHDSSVDDSDTGASSEVPSSPPATIVTPKPVPARPPIPFNYRSPSPHRPAKSSHLNPDTAAASSSAATEIPRSKSPKPPKPSAAEAEYLRKILADVAVTPGNPFAAIFKPPMMHTPSHLHHHSRAHGAPSTSSSADDSSSASAEKGGAASWLGMGVRQFTGIEECLRMFTAVEVLDGENKVGCRRCWKIQNGMLNTTKSKDSDADEEEEGTNNEPVASSQEVTPEPTPSANLERTRPPLQPLSTARPTGHGRVLTSVSTPTVSYYAERNGGSPTRSVSSLPFETGSVSETSDDSSFPNCAPNGDMDEVRGPGGMPIPIISTTAPDTPTGSTPALRTDVIAESLGDVDNALASVPSPHPKLTQELYGYTAASRDSLVIPQRKTYSRKPTVTDETRTDDDSDDLSDVSSLSGESMISRNSEAVSTNPSSISQPAGAAQGNAPPPPVKERKPSKPKPTIMRAAYKRYLIATPPPVLVIHLKRFQQTSKSPFVSFSHGFKKLDDYISFPEYLDLAPFLAPKKEDYGLGRKGKLKEKKGARHPKDERCMYRLYAVVVHIGNMLGGHYIAYTALPSESPVVASRSKSSSQPAQTASASVNGYAGADGSAATPAPAKPKERQWAYISDTVVRLTTLEEVLHAKAYICMYERC